MNREIKFRAQRTDTKEFVYGYYVKDPIGNYRIYLKPFEEATSNTYYTVIPDSVCQFTGLFDKNGKEIYEGDVLKIFNTEGFGVVKFFACSFMVEWVGQDCYSDLLGWYNFKRGVVSKPEDFEIIGTIYENKKLIN